jgi:serine protease Do
LISEELTVLAEQIRPSVVQVASGRRGAGAGMIWREDGLILTNLHVVARSRGVQVLLDDERLLDARMVAHARSLDLALLQVDASELPAVTVGDSTRLRVGELVFAMGHPWGQRNVMTAGIVSGVGEVQVGGNGRTTSYIRSSVRLAPGNSGGPLVDARGQVVGVNSMIFGGDLAVSIPSHVAREVTEKVRFGKRGTERGRVASTIVEF